MSMQPVPTVNETKLSQEINMSKDHLIIFDTTLRDGEQSPGASMTKEEKLRIARQLERMRVDVIEAGFPAASNGDFDAVRAVAEAIKDSTVAGLCRAFDKDIARALEAVKPARSGRIHTFIATSPIHMEKKLRMAPEDVLVAARHAVRFARNEIDDVEFSCEDAGRSDLDFLCRIIEAVIKEGASTINIPDTVGYNVPEQYANRIHQLRERIPNSDKVIWSVHCHNDLGLAVANSLAAVMAGSAPGRMHHQWPWRTRRQCCAGRDRHGGAYPSGCVSLRHAHRYHADRRGIENGVQHHRISGAAEQGDCRRQRICP
jgi:2-isopropylmalate synthase